MNSSDIADVKVLSAVFDPDSHNCSNGFDFHSSTSRIKKSGCSPPLLTFTGRSHFRIQIVIHPVAKTVGDKGVWFDD